MIGVVLPRYETELATPPGLPLKVSPTASRHVRRLQEWLCFAGFNTAIDGEFGPATKSALQAFQRTHLFAATGECDAETWAALSRPLRVSGAATLHGSKFGDVVCAAGALYLDAGAREVGGDNRGPFQRHFARGRENQPWCQDYASTLWFDAARALGITQLPFDLCDAYNVASSYVPWVANAALRAGKLRTADDPRPIPKGSMMFLKSNSSVRYSHVGVVTEARGDVIITNEGNSNNSGSSNGYAVVVQHRRRSSCDYGVCE